MYLSASGPSIADEIGFTDFLGAFLRLDADRDGMRKALETASVGWNSATAVFLTPTDDPLMTRLGGFYARFDPKSGW